MGSLTVYRTKCWPDPDNHQGIPVSNWLDGSTTNTLFMVDWAQQMKLGDICLEALSTEPTTMGPVAPLLSQIKPVSELEQEIIRHSQIPIFRVAFGQTEKTDLANRGLDKVDPPCMNADLTQIFIRSIESRHCCVQIRKRMNVQELKKEI